MTMYITLIMYTTIAQAYKVGKEKLALSKDCASRRTE